MPNGEMPGCAVLHTKPHVYHPLTIRAHCVQAVGAEHAFSRRNSKNGRECDPPQSAALALCCLGAASRKPRLFRTRTGGVGTRPRICGSTTLMRQSWSCAAPAPGGLAEPVRLGLEPPVQEPMPSCLNALHLHHDDVTLGWTLLTATVDRLPSLECQRETCWRPFPEAVWSKSAG